MRLFILIFLSFAISVPIENILVEADDGLNGSYNMKIKKYYADIHPRIQNYNKKLTEQGSEAEYPVKIDRRHIIPLHILENFYNKLVENGDAPKLKPFFTEYNKIFKSFYKGKAVAEGDPNKYDEIIENVNKIVLGLSRGTVIHDENAKRPENLDEFLAFYCWLPGNLFVSPTPWDNSFPPIDSKSNVDRIVGGDTLVTLQISYNAMKIYIDNNTKGTELDKLLEVWITAFSFIVKVSDVQPLNKSKWTLGRDRKYHIKNKQESGLWKKFCSIISCFYKCKED